MKKIILIALILISLAGCNTIAGMGKDVQTAGEAVQNAAGGKK